MAANEHRLRLTEAAYEQLRRATETHREELLVRLLGEVGLRPGEVATLEPRHVTAEGGPGRTHYYVDVPEADGGSRTVYMPPAVAHDFWQYVRSNGIGSDDLVIEVGKRRIQMLIGEVADRAAERTARPSLAGVTPTTLRHYFATQLLVDQGVDARVVPAVGGWEGIDAILRDLPPPTRPEIAEAFEQLEGTTTDRSGWLARIVSTLEAVDEELIGANSRDEIHRRVCHRLTDIYPDVWILERAPHREGFTTRAHAGETPDRFEGGGATGLVQRALQTGNAMVGPDEPGPAVDLKGHGLLGAVPIAHGQTAYGALVVRTERQDGFDKPERTALSALGRRIAFAITATERRLLLMGGTVLEVTFTYDDREAPLVGLATELGCSVTVDGVVPGDDGSLLCFLELEAVAADRALEAATAQAALESARLIQRFEDGARLEVSLAGVSPLTILSERGATVTRLDVIDGEATLVCDVSPETDVRTLHESLAGEFPSVTLKRKRERTTTADDEPAAESLTDHLTDKQRSVIEGAYHAGYFDWPRGSTAEDLAESMGISSPTLHNHLRKAQQQLLATVFETTDPGE